MFPVYDIKLGLHKFVVGDTLGIGTSNYAYNAVRKYNFSFLRDFVITDYVYLSFRSYYGYAVKRVFVKLHIADLDYAFLAEFTALKIVADGDGRLRFSMPNILTALNSIEPGYGLSLCRCARLQLQEIFSCM